MTPQLLDYLCDPVDRGALELVEPVYAEDGSISGGKLVSAAGRSYPVVDGVPRFVIDRAAPEVRSFGDEWNHFNFDDFKSNWLNHTVRNTFGGLSHFRDKLVVDCGAGSGMQSKWISEAGARHVIALELSHAVDGVIRSNLTGMKNVDIVQCSIDAPPLRDRSIDGIVICHNVIQHTQSVEKTARALWRIVGAGGEFVFNCYPKNDLGVLRKLRLALYYAVRAIMSRMPFFVILSYSRIMALLRFLPLIGVAIEKSGLMVRGEVSAGPGWVGRAYKAGVLNTFDCYGSHAYQHLKSDDEIRSLVADLQPLAEKVLNLDRYFARPAPIGIALRLLR